MTSQTHIIKRLVLDLRLEKQENAYNIQNQVSALYKSRILGVLDAVCSQIASPGEYIRLDKLEVDVGSISLQRMEDEFSEKVRRHFHLALIDKLNQDQATPAIFRQKSNWQGDLQAPATDKSLQDVRRTPKKVADLELLQHFLRTGLFPWWSEKYSAEAFEKIVLDLFTTSPIEICVLFEDEFRTAHTRTRVVRQFSDRVAIKIVALMAPESFERIQKWPDDLKRIVERAKEISIPASEIRYIVWDAVLANLVSRPQSEISEKALLCAIVQTIAEKNNVSREKLIGSLATAVDRLRRSRAAFRSTLPAAVTALHSEIRQRSAQDTPAENLLTSPGKSDAVEAKLFARDKHGEMLPGQRSPRSASVRTGEAELSQENEIWPPVDVAETGKILDESDRIEEELIPEAYIENAGLVLLWPYFGIFFKHFDLLENGSFVDDAARTRAIHLLQYLVTAEEQTPEYYLALNKLFCGWPISQPVGRDIKLSTPEKAECKKLLSTAISHWPALKNTSVAGFRTSFLQRNGVLVKQDKNWLLQVESQAYDMLLQHLPWSISIIKLSWMQNGLYVEWNQT